MRKFIIPGLIILFLLVFLNLKNVYKNIQGHQTQSKNTSQVIADNDTVNIAYFNNEPHVFIN